MKTKKLGGQILPRHNRMRNNISILGLFILIFSGIYLNRNRNFNNISNTTLYLFSFAILIISIILYYLFKSSFLEEKEENIYNIYNDKENIYNDKENIYNDIKYI